MATRNFCLLIIICILQCSTNATSNECDNKFSCVLMYSCFSAASLLKSAGANEVRNTYKSCGYENVTPKICCPISETTITFEESSENGKEKTIDANETTRVLERKTNYHETTTISSDTTTISSDTIKTIMYINRTTCGQNVKIVSRVLNGEITGITEHPWVARVLFDTGRRQIYACAATLISDKHLISAAHCFSNPRRIAVSVRLGDWDERTEIDCVDGVCNKPVDMKIDKIFTHPDFLVQPDIVIADICLIKLLKSVEFSGFISPICLPDTPYVKVQDYQQDSLYSSVGWGVTENGSPSSTKLKITLRAVSSEICRSIFPALPESFFKTVICAGGMLGKDTCYGDSGGPLMKTVKEDHRTNWYLLGVISIGSTQCGVEGSPGIYTRVSQYMDWIKKNF